jgi:hypothetical protein
MMQVDSELNCYAGKARLRSLFLNYVSSRSPVDSHLYLNMNVDLRLCNHFSYVTLFVIANLDPKSGQVAFSGIAKSCL